MTQKYHHYKTWEDYVNGQYNVIDFKKVSLVEQEDLIDKASKLLSNPDKFYRIAKQVVKNWPIATEQHLTNLNSNRRAWLGQASCCYECGCCEQLTKIGWHRLPGEYKDRANAVAEKVILEWENEMELAGQLSIFEGHSII